MKALRLTADKLDQLVCIRKLQMKTASVSVLETSNFSQGQGNQQEINHLSGGVVLYAAQPNAQINAEIVGKGGFRTETNYGHIRTKAQG